MTMQQQGVGSAVQAPVSQTATALVEILDRILDKGIVIDVWARVSLVGIELLSAEVRVVIGSVDTYLRYADAIGITANAARPREVQDGQQQSQQDGNALESKVDNLEQRLGELAGVMNGGNQGQQLGQGIVGEVDQRGEEVSSGARQRPDNSEQQQTGGRSQQSGRRPQGTTSYQRGPQPRSSQGSTDQEQDDRQSEQANADQQEEKSPPRSRRGEDQERSEE